MSCFKYTNQRALTLVEVLVALSILAVVLLPVMAGLSQAMSTTSEGSINAAATSIAREKLEQLKATDFTLLDSQLAESRDLVPGDSFFQIAVTVETIRPDDAAGSGLKKAEVIVRRSGSAYPVATITTYFTPAGI